MLIRNEMKKKKEKKEESMCRGNRYSFINVIEEHIVRLRRIAETNERKFKEMLKKERKNRHRKKKMREKCRQPFIVCLLAGN